MKILIAYATSEGHTRDIARTTADRLVDAGHSVELLRVADAGDIFLTRFDGAIIAAPIHTGHYPKSLARFAEARADDLAALPTLFMSVSLAAAGHDADDWLGLERILDDFITATGWKPGQVAQVAGAYKPSEYDIVRRFLMRRIIAAHEPDFDLDNDHIYTDWEGLAQTVDSWVNRLKNPQKVVIG